MNLPNVRRIRPCSRIGITGAELWETGDLLQIGRERLRVIAVGTDCLWVVPAPRFDWPWWLPIAGFVGGAIALLWWFL